MNRPRSPARCSRPLASSKASLEYTDPPFSRGTTTEFGGGDYNLRALVLRVGFWARRTPHLGTV